VEANPPLFRVVDLGTLGGARSAALAVSEAGHVVGWTEVGSQTPGGDSIRHAFLCHNGAMQDLGSLGGPNTESIAYGVNARGQVVGWTQAPFDRHAFLWLPDPAYGLPPGMNDLGTLGHGESEANDINERGEIVGKSDQTIFLWLPEPVFGLAAGMSDLCADFSDSGACPVGLPSINDLGHVAVRGYLWLPYPYYDFQAGWVFIGASISDISNTGMIVGSSSSLYGVYYFIHDLWRHEGSILYFTPWCGFDISCGIPVGLAVNDLGNNVGVWIWSFQVGIFSEPLGADRWWMLDQSRLVYSPGWIVTTASNINNHDVVVGTGKRFDEPERAVMLLPVDPNVDGFGGVTLNDYFEYQQCLTGPCRTAGPLCRRADLEGDGDVDLADYVALLRGFEEEE